VSIIDAQKRMEILRADMAAACDAIRSATSVEQIETIHLPMLPGQEEEQQS